MKIGAEDKTKVKTMAALVAVAVLIIGYNFLTSPSSKPPANTGQTASANTGQAKKAGESAASLDPTVRFDVLRLSQNVVYSSSGRNIFRMEAASFQIGPPIAPVRSQGSQGQGNQVGADPPRPTPTPPPPIPLRFYGFANRPGEPNKVFLSDKGVQFLARDGDIVESRYKIIKINNQVTNPSVVVEDMLTNYRQTISLTAAPN
jgi:hypothetical protein